MNIISKAWRKALLGCGLCTGLGLIGILPVFQALTAEETQQSTSLSFGEALARLKAGNTRFVEGKPQHDHESADWRQRLVSGQHPFAVIVTCADSRVPPELLFDQGFGDLFVIRNAGNVIATDVVGSVEYALAHLKSPVVVVMGHEGCGAVSAALMSRAERAQEPFELRSVLRMIDPAISHLDKADHSEAAVVSAVEANTHYGVAQLKRYRDDLDDPVDDRTFVGAIYEISTGKVRFLEPND